VTGVGGRPRRDKRDVRACATALAVAALGACVADRHPAPDRRLFAALNDHTSEPWVLTLAQQLGTPWILPATALGAAALRRPRLAVCAAAALPVEKALEVGIKKTRPTPRPLYVQPTALRDDAPVEGESFPSGHAAIAFTAARLLVPYLPARIAAAVLVTAAATAGSRISQGAHHPVDAVAGAALGVAIGSGLTFVVGRDDS
jgi:undecaprenyl-diphosphatase